MRTLSLLASCGLFLVAIGPSPVAAQPGAKAAPAPEAPQADASTGGWWNEPKIVETLTLGEEQRKKMDGFLEAFRQELRAGGGPAARRAFTEALTAGDWKEARARLQELSEEASRPLQAHGELKIDVLSALSKEQLAKLVESYPHLIDQPWIRMPRRGGFRQRGGGNR
jgi:Spy/CpxP family protein refolding chaperone